MAIQLDFKWRGVTVPSAYVRIDQVSGSKREEGPTPQMQTEGRWIGAVGIYANEAEPIPFLRMEVSAPWNGEGSPYELLYSTLKALPEFTSSVDC